jgi:hypothetical protein
MTATTSIIAALMKRELRTLKRELQAFPSEGDIWRKPDSLPNSTGTLALHAAGNLRHFIGAVLGKSGYVRDRDAEFSRRNVPVAELQRELDLAIEDIDRVLPGLAGEVMADWYPLPVANRRVRTDEFLVHLASHLAYHLGQADYHRRAITGSGQSVGAVAPGELPGAVSLEG